MDSRACFQACESDSACGSWTFVQAGCRVVFDELPELKFAPGASGVVDEGIDG